MAPLEPHRKTLDQTFLTTQIKNFSVSNYGALQNPKRNDFSRSLVTKLIQDGNLALSTRHNIIIFTLKNVAFSTNIFLWGWQELIK